MEEQGNEPDPEIESDPPAQDLGPGAPLLIHLEMEDLLDKLKLLNYEHEFLKTSAAYKPASKHYFALSTNSGEQFFMFTSLASWLIEKCGNSKFDMPQEHDDPNATVSRILDALRKLGETVDFPPAKLKTGSGEHCIFVLDKLANHALKTKEFAWESSIIVPEDLEEAVAGADESELTAEQFEEVEDVEAAEDDDDDEGGFLDLEGLKNMTKKGMVVEEVKKEMLVSDTDAAAWKLEVERVMPSLKITIRQDAKDWRSHLEQMESYKASIADTMKTAGTHLDRLAGDIGKNLEKITSREKYLNGQLDALLSQFRATQDRLAETRERYKEASGGVTDRSKTLAQITDDLDGIRQEMEDRGLSITDGAPLVKVKQALSRLQQELTGLDVQTGVIEQALLQAQLRDRTHLQNDMYAQPIELV